MPHPTDLIVVIPARYRSSRFPGKPLAMIVGMSLVERTWRRTCEACPPDRVFVATDDQRIFDHVTNFGGQAIMTSPDHPTGTDRCHEVAVKLDAKTLINVQGDEPLIDPDTIRRVIEESGRLPDVTVNAMSRIDDDEDFRNPNVPKVVAAPEGRLLYMSRAPIPTTKKAELVDAWRQVCVYGFSRAALDAFASVGGRTPLEAIEDIEILRLLELGEPVHMVEVPPGSIAVDEPGDIDRVATALGQRTSSRRGPTD